MHRPRGWGHRGVFSNFLKLHHKIKKICPPANLKKTVRPPLEKFSGCTHEGEVTGCEGPWFNSMHNESMTEGHGNRALPCLSTLGSAGLSSRLLLLFSSRLWDRTGSATTDNRQWKHGRQILWQKQLCTSDQQYMRTKYIHDHNMLNFFFLSWKWILLKHNRNQMVKYIA